MTEHTRAATHRRTERRNGVIRKPRNFCGPRNRCSQTAAALIQGPVKICREGIGTSCRFAPKVNPSFLGKMPNQFEGSGRHATGYSVAFGLNSSSSIYTITTSRAQGCELCLYTNQNGLCLHTK